MRVRKTNQIDAEKLASSQFILNRKPTYVQEEVYQNLRDLSRFYQNLTEDIVRTKNSLHKVLQIAFPEIKNLLYSYRGTILEPRDHLSNQALEAEIISS